MKRMNEGRRREGCGGGAEGINKIKWAQRWRWRGASVRRVRFRRGKRSGIRERVRPEDRPEHPGGDVDAHAPARLAANPAAPSHSSIPNNRDNRSSSSSAHSLNSATLGSSIHFALLPPPHPRGREAGGLPRSNTQGRRRKGRESVWKRREGKRREKEKEWKDDSELAGKEGK